MSDKNKRYLALDLTIATAFLLSLGTGFAWLMSGRGSDGPAPLGITRRVWFDLHVWSSLVMIAGAVMHVAFHWDWIAAMSRRWLLGRARKARWNYVVDAVLGLVLAAAIGTGLPFLLAGGGYQGGRNPGFRAVLLGLNRGTLSDLHSWLGLVFLAVFIVHQVLHWAWIRHTVARLGRSKRPELCPSVVAVVRDE